MPSLVLCAHGHAIPKDPCPGCETQSKTPHPADPVTVKVTWSKRPYRRCRQCGKQPGHPIHRTN